MVTFLRKTDEKLTIIFLMLCKLFSNISYSSLVLEGYYLTGSNELCPVRDQIENEIECRTLGYQKDWYIIEEESFHPKGCYLVVPQENFVIWNTHSNGTRDKNSKAICKKQCKYTFKIDLRV